MYHALFSVSIFKKFIFFVDHIYEKIPDSFQVISSTSFDSKDFLIGHLHCFLFVTQGITNACTMHKHQAAFENNVIYLSTLFSFALTYFSASCAFKISFCMLTSKRANQQMGNPSLLLKIFGSILKIILDSSSSIFRLQQPALKTFLLVGIGWLKSFKRKLAVVF